MSIEAFAARLRDLEVFHGLEPEQLLAIARSMERIVFKPGQHLVDAGCEGDGAYVIVSGDAETLPMYDDEQPEPIESGSLVGEMAMLIEHKHKIGVIACGQVRALKIARSALHALLLEDPPMAEHFVGKIASRLTRMAVELRRIDQMLALAGEATEMNAPASHELA